METPVGDNSVIGIIDNTETIWHGGNENPPSETKERHRNQSRTKWSTVKLSEQGLEATGN